MRNKITYFDIIRDLIKSRKLKLNIEDFYALMVVTEYCYTHGGGVDDEGNLECLFEITSEIIDLGVQDKIDKMTNAALSLYNFNVKEAYNNKR